MDGEIILAQYEQASGSDQKWKESVNGGERWRGWRRYGLRLKTERRVSWFIYNDYKEKKGRKSRTKKKMRKYKVILIRYTEIQYKNKLSFFKNQSSQLLS
jgi:hypothetical protein